MSTVDRRIVDMQFNNKQFEDGIQSSLKSLDNLNKGLNDAGKGDALHSLRDGVEHISSKFTALGIIGVTTLQNITNAAVDAGIKLAKSLTLDPVMDGFQEYELKMGSIQTIMSGSGESLETVNGYLDELNTYADKTIYSFKDMTSNIGKFTNAGVNLESAVNAIQGVSNLAAVSGANANEASRAMYNFAQALSAGYVKLIDWKSIENANMATVEFKTYLLEAGVAAGTLRKTAEGMYEVLTKNGRGYKLDYPISATKGFNEALAYQWMTTDVLVDTLKDYADETTDIGKKAFAAAQDVKTFTQLLDTLKEAVGSGWAQTFEIIIGDFEEAKALWTGVNNVVSGFIDNASDARNELLKGWDELGGRTAMLESLKNIFEAIIGVIKPISKAFRDIFPPITAERIYNITEAVRLFSEKLIISDATSDKLRRTFAGLFSVVSVVADAFKFLFNVGGEVLRVIFPMSGGILALTAKIGDFLVGLRESVTAADIFSKGLEKVREFLDALVFDVLQATVKIRLWLTQLGDYLKDVGAVDIFKKGLDGIREFLIYVADGVQAAVEKIGHWFGQFGGIDLGPLEVFSDRTKVLFSPFTFLLETAEKVFNGIKKVFDWVSPYLHRFAVNFGNAMKKLGEVLGNATGVTGLPSFLELLNTILTGGVLLKLMDFLGELKEMTSGASGFLSNITAILDGVRGSLEAYQTKLKSQAILNIAIAIGVLAASLWVLSTISIEEMQGALTAITILFAELSAVMLILSKNFGAVKMGAISAQMMGIAVAVLILSAACKNLSGLSWEEMSRGLLGIAGLLASLIIFEKLIGDGKGLMKIGFALIPLSTGLLIMAQAMKSMAGLSWEELAKGLVGVGGALLVISALSNVADPKRITALGFSMTGLGVGMIAIAAAMVIMGSMEWEAIHKGLAVFGGSLLAVTALSNIVNPASLLAMGVSMIGLGVGLNIMAAALLIMGSMEWEAIHKGLATLGGSLLAVTAMSNITNPASLLAMGASMIGLGAGLNIMAAALLIMGSMQWESIHKALAALGGSLLILAAAMNLMKGALGGAAALTAVSLALAILVPSLVILGMMDLDNIGRMLLALGGTLGIFAVAALLLAPVAPVMLALAGAMALLGGGILALGVGLGLCSVAMTAFAVAGTAGAVAITAMVTSLIGLIPMAIQKIGEGLVLLVGTLVEAIPGVLVIIGTLLEGIINLVIEYSPKLMVMVGVLLTELLALLLTYVPQIVDVALQMIVGILNKIAENIDDIIAAGVSIIVSLLKGIAENIPRIVEAIFEMLEAIALEISLFLPRLADLGFDMVISFLNELTKTLDERIPELVNAFWDMVDAITDGIVYALEEGVPRLKENIEKVAEALWNAFKEFFGIGNYKNDKSTVAEEGGGSIIGGIINGLIGGITSVVNAIKDVAGNIWDGFKDFFGISSPSTLAEEGAGYITDGLEKGIKGGENGVLAAVAELSGGIADGLSGFYEVGENAGDSCIQGMSDSLRNISYIFDEDMDFHPTITPVLDMSDVESEWARVQWGDQTLDLSTAKSRAAALDVLRAERAANQTTGDVAPDKSCDCEPVIFNQYNTIRGETDKGIIQKINEATNVILTRHQRGRGVHA